MDPKQRSYASIPSKDLSAQRSWKALIQREGKDKTGKNVDVLNFIRNSWVCSHHFDEEKISPDGCMNRDPVYFASNNQKKPLVRGRLERHRSAKPQMSVSAVARHVVGHG